MLVGLLSISAQASVSVQTESDESLAVQIARRVAAMENSKDLPSRAVWLTSRVAKNSKALALQASKEQSRKKPAKKSKF